MEHHVLINYYRIADEQVVNDRLSYVINNYEGPEDFINFMNNTYTTLILNFHLYKPIILRYEMINNNADYMLIDSIFEIIEDENKHIEEKCLFNSGVYGCKSQYVIDYDISKWLSSVNPNDGKLFL